MTDKDYYIDRDIKTAVDVEISKYYTYLLMKDEPVAELDYYQQIPIQSYDRVNISKTNNISKTVEIMAVEMASRRERKANAERIVDAIDRGIKRAAYSGNRTDFAKQLRLDLFDNMVNKVAQHAFRRDPRTFAKYRRRAYYCIAEELGIIDGYFL